MQCLGDGDVSTVYRRAILTIVTVLVNPTADDLLRLMVTLYTGALAGFYHLRPEYWFVNPRPFVVRNVLRGMWSSW